jgi:hypothetical protein
MKRWLPLTLPVGVWLLAIAAPGCQGPLAASPPLRDEYRRFLFAGREVGKLDAAVVERTQLGKNRVEKIRITTEAGQEAFVRVLRPLPDRKYPVILLQHFLGGTKDDVTMSFLLNAFAARGYLAAAIDARYRGERGKGRKLAQAMRQAIETGKGHPWLIDTVFDITRTLDYLQARPDVDPRRIGMVGISEGGIETWMAAAADERIAVAVPVIGVTRFQCVIRQAAGPAGKEYLESFRGALSALAREMGEKEVNERVIRAAWEKLLPGFNDRFDALNLVPLIAPRPLLILSHEKDQIIPLDGAREVYEATRSRYAELHASDRLQMRVAPDLEHAGLDQVEIGLIFSWCDRWLKPDPVPAAAGGPLPVPSRVGAPRREDGATRRAAALEAAHLFQN